MSCRRSPVRLPVLNIDVLPNLQREFTLVSDLRRGPIFTADHQRHFICTGHLRGFTFGVALQRVVAHAICLLLSLCTVYLRLPTFPTSQAVCLMSPAAPNS